MIFHFRLQLDVQVWFLLCLLKQGIVPGARVYHLSQISSLKKFHRNFIVSKIGDTVCFFPLFTIIPFAVPSYI